MRPFESVPAPRWSRDQLDEARRKAIEHFRRERLEHPEQSSAVYVGAFDDYRATVEELFQTTGDLGALRDGAIAVLTDKKKLEAFRYLAAPPISLDDLKTLTGASSLSRARLREDHEAVNRIVQVVQAALDQRRFPWVGEQRDPAEAERQAAVLATTALLACSRVETLRRSTMRDQQERRVKAALSAAALVEMKTRKIMTLGDAPGAGQFCGESLLGQRKADVVVGLWDGRILALECKVSNSATNSIKRFDNDVAAKAEKWRAGFGTLHVVPAAVLSGVYHLAHLEAAQERGLTVFWAHDLDRLVTWIESTSPPPDEPGDLPMADKRRG